MDQLSATINKLCDYMVADAAFSGFGQGALKKAAQEIGIDSGLLALCTPNGVADILTLYLARADEAMIKAAEATDGGIFAKTRAGLMGRFMFFAENKEAARRAGLRLAMPDLLPVSLSHVWASADKLWRAMGDNAPDFNHYSKRALLAGIICTGFGVFLADDSDDLAQTMAYIDARLADVGKIEKVKRKWADSPKPDIVSFLTRLRYGAQPQP